jgi:hypothetical protein
MLAQVCSGIPTPKAALAYDFAAQQHGETGQDLNRHAACLHMLAKSFKAFQHPRPVSHLVGVPLGMEAACPGVGAYQGEGPCLRGSSNTASGLMAELRRICFTLQHYT